MLSNNLGGELIIYPFPLRLVGVGAYGQSIISFVNALGRITDVFLLGTEEGELIKRYVVDELGESVSPRFNYVKVENERFGIKSNKLFFTASVAEFIEKKKKNNRVFVYTRDLKTLRNLQYRRWRGGDPVWVLEAHQIKSEILCQQGKHHKLKAEKRLEQDVYNKLNVLFPISTMLHRSICRKFDIKHVDGSVLPVGVSDRFFLTENPEKKYDLVYAGGFVKWKGVDVIIDALKNLKDNGRNLSLLMIGGSTEQVDWLNSIIKGRGLGDNVHLTGRLSNRKIPALLETARVGIVTVTYDGDGMLFTSPLKLYEYFATGLSVVAARAPSLQSDIPEELINWAMPECSESYAKAILNALSSPDNNRDERMRFAMSFTWDKRAERVVQSLYSKEDV